MKVALRGKLTGLMQESFLLYNYEHLYRSVQQRNRDGNRPLISNNFGNLTTLRSIENQLLYHPLFGKNMLTPMNVSFVENLYNILSYFG